MIFDTDLIVWVLRGHPGAIRLVEGVPLAERRISAISYLELLYGCRDKLQLQQLVEHVSIRYSEVLPVSETITSSALQIMERFALSHRPEATDVLIAATALSRGEQVATANVKHFGFIPGLVIKPFRP